MAQFSTIGSNGPSLNENVAANLLTTKSNWQQLEKLGKLIGTNRDNHALREKM
jgi:hypothetical protein